MSENFYALDEDGRRILVGNLARTGPGARFTFTWNVDPLAESSDVLIINVNGTGTATGTRRFVRWLRLRLLEADDLRFDYSGIGSLG